MYYLCWEEQDIPGCSVGSNLTSIWSRKITIRAKEDFLGGNAVLCDGIDELENYVFVDGDPEKSSSADRDTPDEVGNGDYSKGFPRVSVNVTPPQEDVELEQTIYMGETMDKKEIATMLIQAGKAKAEKEAVYYWEYVTRFVNYFNWLIDNGDLKKPSPEDDNTITLEKGKPVPVDEKYSIIKTLHLMNRSGNYIPSRDEDKLVEGSMKIISNRILGMMESTDPTKKLTVENLSELLVDPSTIMGDKGNHDDTVAGNTENYLYIPYIYLPDNPNPGAQTNSTGTGTHKRDVIGYLYFHVTEQYEGDEIVYPQFPVGATTDTLTRKAGLTVSFAVRDADKRADWNNNQAIQEKDGNGKLVYGRDTDYKPAPGTATVEANRIIINGSLTTFIVSGEIQLQVNIQEDQMGDMKEGADFHYEAMLYREYNIAAADEVDAETGIATVAARAATRTDLVGTLAIDGTIMRNQFYYTATFSATEGYGYVEEYGLPLGTYTLVENEGKRKVPDASKGYKYGGIRTVSVADADGRYNNELFEKGTGLSNPGLYPATIVDGSISFILGDPSLGDEGYLGALYGLAEVVMEPVGDLVISKTVKSADGCPEHHKNKDFTFTVTLTASAPTENPDDGGDEDIPAPVDDENSEPGDEPADPKQVNGTFVGVKDGKDGKKNVDVEFKNGVATVTLKDGETITIEDLPADYSYTVVEQSDDGYITVPKDGAEGTIAQRGTTDAAKAEFTNLAVHTLTVHKDVRGNQGDKTKVWNFTVTMTLPSYADAKDYDLSGWKMVGDEYVRTFTLTDNQNEVFAGLPCGAEYTVVEAEANQDGYGTSMADTGNNKLLGNATVTFTNTKPKTDVTITKEVISTRDEDKQTPFKFTIKVELPADAVPSGDGYDCVIGGATGKKLVLTGTNPYTGTIDGKDSFDLKDGESIVISSLPVGTKVTVTEESNSDFATTYDPATRYVTIIADDATVPITVTNTRIKYDLTLSKTVVGDNTSEREEFEFTITLTDSENKPVNGTFTFEGTVVEPKDTNEITFTDGEATVKLKHGQSITIKDLPEGANYQILEAANANYTTKVNGATPATDRTASGKLTTDTEVKYENTLIYYDLTLSKTINADGDDLDENAEFEFTIQLTDRNDKPVSGEFTFTGEAVAPTDGKLTFVNGSATVKLKHDQSITIKDLPSGTKYSIVETNAPGYRATVTGNNASGTLAGDVEVAYENTPIKYFDLALSKTVSGNMGSRTEVFEFTITLTNGTDPVNGEFEIEGTPTEPADGKITFGADGKATVKLTHGQSVTIKNLPDGTAYTITESAATGYTTKVNGEVSSTRSISAGLNGKNATVEFENTRTGIVPTGVGLEIGWLAGLMLIGCGGMAGIVRRRRRLR